MNTEREQIDGESVELSGVSEQTPTHVENDPFAKGRERLTAVSEKISSSKEKMKSIMSSVGSKISRFWSRTKSVGFETAAAVLSTDDLIKKGHDALNEKVDEKVEQAFQWVDGKVNQVTDFVENKYDAAINFKDEKIEQVKAFAQDKVDLAKDAAFFVKEKTTEGLDKVKGGISNRYNAIKNFGENAIMSAKMEVARVKEAYNAKKNAMRLRRLTAEHNKVTTAEAAAFEVVEMHRKRREELEEKMGLLSGLSAA